ncbi:MAG: response regulator [Candidatus Omnitrophica bacterium]|nr:response regulator [Candidatus Omnitrophota bacterium]
MSKKILIVDDNEQDRMIMKRYLYQAGYYNLFMAESGKEALTIAFSEKPDLIILDIMMPVLSGSEVGEILKKDQRTNKIPIIFLTGLLQKEEAEHLGYQISGDHFLSKPVKPQELISIVETIFG